MNSVKTHKVSYYMHSLSWDNLRYVLTVMDTGSVSAAARQLGVNHATVLRRIAAFEAEYEGAVFEKSVNGYKVLPHHARLVEAIREVENGVLSVQRLMQGANMSLKGVVRVSSTDTICHYLLPQILDYLQQQAPEIEIELMSGNSHLDFARMEADIFVRPAMSLPEYMVAEQAAHLIFRAYGIDGCQEQWCGLRGPLAKSAAGIWQKDNIPPHLLTSGSDSFLVLHQLAKRGCGIAILPSFVGERDQSLIHLSDKMPDIPVPIWVGSHEDLRDTPRIRAVRRCISARITAAS